MKPITKTLVDFAIFAVYGVEERKDGKISVRILDFSNDCLYNDFINKDDINKKLISKEEFEMLGGKTVITGFVLPTGKRVSIEYDDPEWPYLPTDIYYMTNHKKMEYYDDGSIKRIASLDEITQYAFWDFKFKKGEFPIGSLMSTEKEINNDDSCNAE